MAGPACSAFDNTPHPDSDNSCSELTSAPCGSTTAFLRMPSPPLYSFNGHNVQRRRKCSPARCGGSPLDGTASSRAAGGFAGRLATSHSFFFNGRWSPAGRLAQHYAMSRRGSSRARPRSAPHPHSRARPGAAKHRSQVADLHARPGILQSGFNQMGISADPRRGAALLLLRWAANAFWTAIGRSSRWPSSNQLREVFPAAPVAPRPRV